MNASTTPLALRPEADFGRPALAGPGEGPPLAVDRLPDGKWQLTLHDLEPVSVRRLTSDKVHIILAPPHAAAPPVPAAATAAPHAPAGPPPPAGESAPAPIQIDTAARTVTVDGRQIDVPRLEFDLLAHLVLNPRRAFTRQQLMAAVWPDCRSSARTVDVHIARLRRRLGPGLRNSISTVFGVGYKYLPTP
ncbi:winged helix-turn-helix domain-containing protein [Streptomyces sp. RS10V-4]|uniref:winged helix-turn-helix domain-containing protein n=1 Tax=Streptomyces rhizoryzae TaxID=2932493 RepID=UPI0020045F02|nr:winged helix-turn-helix domain-containing protein [Streptomyces rhizoryzae]MCK7625131.1 winged helix-turn-helix domain-containing protein [Streptomyces rhizoryzae]